MPQSELLSEKVQKQIARQRFRPANSLNLAWLRKHIQNTCKYAQQSCFKESKFRKQICLKLTFILFEEGLKSTKFTFLSSRWISKRLILAVQKLSRSDSHKKLSSFCFAVGF